MTILKCAAASVIAVVGFSTASFAQPSEQTPDASGDDCPAFVQNAKLVVRDLADGVTITISTQQADHVAPLRNATRGVVDLVEQHEHTGPNSEPQFPPMAIDVKDAAHGVVVTIRAKNKSDVPDLRKSAHALDEVWQSSTCINPAMTSRT